MKPTFSSLRQRPHPNICTALSIAVVGLSLALGGRATAQQPRPRPVVPDPTLAAITSDSLRIYLVTMGQGDEVYEVFGHDAIWVHDPSKAIDTVYNWGVFSFDQPNFVLRFLHGDMRYMMLGEPLDATIGFYKSLNRDMWAQQLNLTDAEKKTLIDFLHWNERPENSSYRYDYYLDNCSTRVRDAIDRATGGQIRPQLKAIETDETYRSHSLRLMQGMKAMVSGVELLLGRPTDTRLSADETSFLPVQLMKHLRGMKLDGGKRPLFTEEFVVNASTRPREPENVPRLWLWFAPVSIALTALVLWLERGLRAGKRRRGTAFVLTFLSAVLGILGLIITLLVTVTDHTAAHANENFFMLNPLWFVIALLAPMGMLRQRPRPRTMMLIRGAAAFACLAVLVHVVGLSRQANWDAIVLLLPVELAISWTLTRTA